ncbi:MAG: DNA-binding response regulator [Betaproteobacteria bacterium]|nr:DNA-binding response regulator [Betaproteobacteria bacterium]
MNNLSYATTSCSKGLILDTVNRTAITVVDVVVIEDHPLYVEALLSLLSVALSGRKIERFRDIESAEPLLRVANPTVILLDLMLPGLRGTDALRRVRQQCPDAVMVTISGADDPVQVSACFAAAFRASFWVSRARFLTLSSNFHHCSKAAVPNDAICSASAINPSLVGSTGAFPGSP